MQKARRRPWRTARLRSMNGNPGRHMSDPYPNTHLSPLSTLITDPDWTRPLHDPYRRRPVPQSPPTRSAHAFHHRLAFASAWCVGWFWLRGRPSSGWTPSRLALKARGYDLSWSSRTFSGFPFRLDVNLTDARVAEPSGWALRIPELNSEAMIYDLTTGWVAPRGALLTRPNGGDVAIAGEALRASLAGMDQHPPRISIEGAKLVFSTAPGRALPAALGRHHAAAPAPRPRRPGRDPVQGQRRAGQFHGPAGSHRPGQRPPTMILDARLTHVSYLRGENWADAVQATGPPPPATSPCTSQDHRRRRRGQGQVGCPQRRRQRPGDGFAGTWR
jgi:hypothetical protein